jgi:hypothetical protein
MKKQYTNTLLVSLATSVFALSGANGALVSITNPSFEANVNPDAAGRFSFGEEQDFPAPGITGWTARTSQNTIVADGAERAVGFINITPANGTQVMVLYSGASAIQSTNLAWSSLAIGDVLTMTVAMGDRNNTGAPVWADKSFFGIVDSTVGTNIATLLGTTIANSGELATPFTGGLGIKGGTMQDRSFTYTVVAGDLARSGNVGLLLAAYGGSGTNNGINSSGNQAFFDNVRLDLAPIPEPSAALLGGLGALLLLRRRR